MADRRRGSGPRGTRWGWRSGWRAALVVLAWAAIAHAQAQSDERAQRARELDAQAAALVERGDFAAAAELYRRLIELQPGSFIGHYNLACTQAQRGDVDTALESLERAIELGLDDLTHITLDPHLEPVRRSPRFAELVERWPQIIESQGRARFEEVLDRFGDRYRAIEDERLRVRFAVGLPAESFALARAELDSVAHWALDELFTNLDDAHAVPWVSVIVPTDGDFARWASQRHGERARDAARQIAGTYDHDRKELVCKDLGATLRHEVFHALHYRSMALEGQRHAAWILEGMAALVEDFNPGRSGPAFTPSWRTNIARKALRLDSLMTIEDLATMPDHVFVGQLPLTHYGLARTFMLYLYAAGELDEFYHNYLDTYRQDRSGLAAIERTFNAEMPQVEASYRRWLEQLPVAPEQNHPPGVSLGMDVDGERGEGLEVLRTLRGSPARAAGVARGDVLVAINAQGVRDINELYRVLGRYGPGQRVTLTVRRGRHLLELPARLADRERFPTITLPGR